MTYPNHMLLTWGGTFGSEPLEIWSNGIRLINDPDVDGSSFDAPADGGSQSLVDAYAAKVKTHYANVNSGYGSNVRLQWIKFNHVGPDGRQVNQQKTWTNFVTPATGTAGAGESTGPITHAMCVTFLTNANRGRASRGRVFVPHPSMTMLGSSYRYTATQCTAVVAQWLTFLSDLADAPGIDGPNSIRPAVISNLETGGPFRVIRQAQIGDFPDHMGSRRNRTREVRKTSTAVVDA
jgi:hypothetical protein